MLFYADVQQIVVGLSKLTTFDLQDWQSFSPIIHELARGPSFVQTTQATPARTANMVGVCFLSQLLDVTA